MPPIVTSEVIAMPETSNRNLPSTDATANATGHRSTQRASTAEQTSDRADEGVRAPQAEPFRDVCAVFGVEPEIQAYAMAKYSRSALSMKESLREISQQKAEKFLNTFYF